MREILSPEKIAELCDGLEGVKNIAAINRLYRQQDESNLWPISGRFNSTERAIRQALKFRAASGVTGLEYSMLIDGLMSDIVNHQ